MAPPKRIISVSIHLGDWETGTKGWDATEHGAYWNLVRAMYSANGSLPAKDDARLKRISACKNMAEWKRVRATIMGKFYVDGDDLRHNRVDEVLEDIARKSALARKAQKAKEAKKRKKNNDSGQRTQSGCSASPKPSTQYNNIICQFDEFYGHYPVTAYSSRPKSREIWVEMTEDDREWALGVVATYAKAIPPDANHIPSPQRWLMDERFKNYNKAPSTTSTAFIKPQEGTARRLLYDAAKECHVSNNQFRAWFCETKVTIHGMVIYARNGFLHKRISKDFGHVIARAGMKLAGTHEAPPSIKSEEKAI